MFKKSIILAIFWLLLIDLISKYLFFDMELLPKVFEASFNTGISFSIPVNQLFVEWITVAFLIGVWIAYYKGRIHPVIATLIIAWWLGNLLDRIFLWWVRDFIWLWFWPIFNIADIYINLAVVYYILFELSNKK